MPEILEIPIIQNDARFKIRTILEDVEVVLFLHWNNRRSRWYISIFDSEEIPLLVGVPLNINTEFLFRYEIDGLPPGKMMLFDSSQQIVESGRDDLGDRCKLLYETSV